MNNSDLKIGTRGSVLALAQTDWALGEMRRLAPARNIERVIIETQGDKDQTSSLSSFGGVGVFVAELQSAILDGRVDAAVHSYKDMASRPTDGLKQYFPPREAVCDSLVGCPLDELREGATVGTGSPRRVAQLRRRRPDLNIQPLRGNITTRLSKQMDGTFDAVVLAKAGLKRARMFDPLRDFDLDPMDFTPATGQGQLALECRETEELPTEEGVLTSALDRRLAVVERFFAQELGFGCHTPAAVWARVEGRRIAAVIDVLSHDGHESLKIEVPVSLSHKDGDLQAALAQAEDRGIRAFLKDII
ncbi:hydroxymethylbilane synthase [Alphaproteobacteria bacterium]|nr:hydroxymethylbilane synthase [Alphaproteobacteria bacterium]